jgi:hypothetical protein
MAIKRDGGPNMKDLSSTYGVLMAIFHIHRQLVHSFRVHTLFFVIRFLRRNGQIGVYLRHVGLFHERAGTPDHQAC